MKQASQQYYLTLELLPGLFITNWLKIQDINFIKSNNIGLIIYHYLDYLTIQPIHTQDPSIKILQFKYQLIQNKFCPSKLKNCCDQLLKQIKNIGQQQMTAVIPIQTLSSRSMLIACLIVMTKLPWSLMTTLQFLKVKIINFNIQNYYLKLLIIYQRFLKRDKQIINQNVNQIGLNKISLDLKVNSYIRNQYQNSNIKNSTLISYKSAPRYKNITQRSQRKAKIPQNQLRHKSITQMQPNIKQKKPYQIAKKLNIHNQHPYLKIRQKVYSYRQVAKINDKSQMQVQNKLKCLLQTSQQISRTKREKIREVKNDLSERIIDKKYHNLITIIDPLQIKIDKKYGKSHIKQKRLDKIQ